MEYGKDKAGPVSDGSDIGTLFKGIYKFPEGMSPHQRLALRSRQLHELTAALERAIKLGVPREFLSVFTWAVDYIAIEIKVIADRMEVQERCREPARDNAFTS